MALRLRTHRNASRAPNAPGQDVRVPHLETAPTVTSAWVGATGIAVAPTSVDRQEASKTFRLPDVMGVIELNVGDGQLYGSPVYTPFWISSCELFPCPMSWIRTK